MVFPVVESPSNGERRVRVVRNCVECPRIGSAELDRCRECPYLVTLHVMGEPPSGYVVCADADVDPGSEHAW